ncbi:hypothetical protein [Escherichia coli]|uniref:hypothetical protein n=1 Tax=Escherichia coli TaxID=562 RepID=UPI003F8D364D
MPELHLPYPTNKLPDLRGEFNNAWDDGLQIMTMSALFSIFSMQRRIMLIRFYYRQDPRVVTDATINFYFDENILVKYRWFFYDIIIPPDSKQKRCRITSPRLWNIIKMPD